MGHLKALALALLLVGGMYSCIRLAEGAGLRPRHNRETTSWHGVPDAGHDDAADPDTGHDDAATPDTGPPDTGPHALDFPGTDDWASIPDSAGLTPTTKFSICAWFNPDVLGAGKVIAAQYESVVINGTWILDLGATQGRVRLFLCGNAACATGSYCQSAVFNDISKWSFTCAVYDGTQGTAANRCTVYTCEDGAACVGSTGNVAVSGGSNPASLSDSSADITLGGYRDSLHTTITNEIDGRIDEVSFYAATALTSGNVTSIYNAGVLINNPITTGLSGYWQMNEGTGTTVTDATGNGHTLTLQADTVFTTNTP